MTRIAKFFAAAALLMFVATPAMASPYHNQSHNSHGHNGHGHSNHGRSSFNNHGHSYHGHSSHRSTYGYGIPNYGFNSSVQGCGLNVYRAPSYGYGYGAVYANPQAFGFGPYNW